MDDTDLSLDERTTLSALEKRVRSLEAEVVNLKDTQAIEERILDRLKDEPPAPAPQMQFTPELPRVETPLRVETPRRLEAPREPILPQELPRMRPSSWIVIEMYRDLKSMVMMFFDIRFHVGWTSRIAAIILLPAILLSGLWFPLAYVPFFGGMLNAVLHIVLAFILFKFLSRDARRYRETRR